MHGHSPSVPQPYRGAQAPGALFPTGGGDMGALMRSRDWSRTPLGPAEGWPPSLRSAIDTCLNSRFPLVVIWGPQRAMFYNDALRPMLGDLHPLALGRDYLEVFPELEPLQGPQIEAVRTRGASTYHEDQQICFDRDGFLEEMFWSYSWSPIHDETGRVGGCLHPAFETTFRVLGQRRLRTMRELVAQAMTAQTADEACRRAAEILSTNPEDLPFALLYLLEADGRTARLAASAGLAAGTPASPPEIRMEERDHGTGWPLGPVARQYRTGQVDDLLARFGRLACGVWPEPPHTALILPVARMGSERPIGFLIAGLSPRLRLDQAYRDFLESITTHLATAVANACAYDEERRRARALAELDRAKTAFFSNVSHEFRTPLTLLLGPLEEALSAPALGAEVREKLAVAHRNSLRLLKLVNALLDFARVEAGRAQAVYQATDLAAVTADLASSFRSACERAGLRLVVDCPPLPEPVYVDRDLWEKIVLNLLSNDFKFTFEGEIGVTLRPVGNGVELTVRDTGTGIPAAELPRIFERFHRVENARSRTHEGTGIGLALVQELATLHGGTVQAASTVGVGTTFVVRLPFGSAHLPADRIGDPATPPSAGATLAQAFAEEALRWLPEDGTSALPGPPRAAASPVGRAAGPRPRVLLADDNADMRAYVRRLLADRYEVEPVADGQAALETARRTRPDLVLSDVMMPRLDGFGLLRALRADPALSDVPIVLLSARAGEETQVEGLEAGADDYLVKPFGARELLARVHSNLVLAALRRQGEVRRRLLADEFNHRVKNTLATVQSIVSQALRAEAAMRDTQVAIEARLAALARSHDLLTRESWQTTGLQEVAGQALEPFGYGNGRTDRFAIDGREVHLPPRMVLALGTVFHELATNAAKYGALSNDRGTIRLAWMVTDDRLRWEERDGPPVTPPTRTGFGVRLIERSLTHELGGEVRLDYAPTGIVCEIAMAIPPGPTPRKNEP